MNPNENRKISTSEFEYQRARVSMITNLSAAQVSTIVSESTNTNDNGEWVGTSLIVNPSK